MQVNYPIKPQIMFNYLVYRSEDNRSNELTIIEAIL